MQEKYIEIPSSAAVCAARHFIAAHESAKRREAVDFGAVCEGCRFAMDCRANWLKAAAPIFEAAGEFPLLTGDREKP